MKLLEEEHEQVIKHLKEIKNTFVEMRDAGLGGEDFESLYITQRLIPTIYEVFDLER